MVFVTKERRLLCISFAFRFDTDRSWGRFKVTGIVGLVINRGVHLSAAYF